MRRVAVLAVIALVFGMLTATAAAADSGADGGQYTVGQNGPGGPSDGNGPGGPGGDPDPGDGEGPGPGAGPGPGDGSCDGAGSGECDGEGPGPGAGPGPGDGTGPGDEAPGEQEREREQHRVRACTGNGDCDHDPVVDPVRTREQTRRQVWEHRGGEFSCESVAIDQAFWMLRHRFRYRTMLARV